jgi:hypothetical protein
LAAARKAAFGSGIRRRLEPRLNRWSTARCLTFEFLDSRLMLSAASGFQVNTFTAGAQESPKAASDAEGDYVIAWQSGGQDGDGNGIYAQRYSAAGAAQGSEFRVNTHTSGNQQAPAVAMDSTGDFVIAWQSDGQDGDGNGIYAQL